MFLLNSLKRLVIFLQITLKLPIWKKSGQTCSAVFLRLKPSEPQGTSGESHNFGSPLSTFLSSILRHSMNTINFTNKIHEKITAANTILYVLYNQNFNYNKFLRKQKLIKRNNFNSSCVPKKQNYGNLCLFALWFLPTTKGLLLVSKQENRAI